MAQLRCSIPPVSLGFSHHGVRGQHITLPKLPLLSTGPRSGRPSGFNLCLQLPRQAGQFLLPLRSSELLPSSPLQMGCGSPVCRIATATTMISFRIRYYIAKCFHSHHPGCSPGGCGVWHHCHCPFLLSHKLP